MFEISIAKDRENKNNENQWYIRVGIVTQRRALALQVRELGFQPLALYTHCQISFLTGLKDDLSRRICFIYKSPRLHPRPEWIPKYCWSEFLPPLKHSSQYKRYRKYFKVRNKVQMLKHLLYMKPTLVPFLAQYGCKSCWVQSMSTTREVQHSFFEEGPLGLSTSWTPTSNNIWPLR